MRTTTTNARPSWLGIYPATPDIYSDTPHSLAARGYLGDVKDEWSGLQQEASDAANHLADRIRAHRP